MTHCCDTLSVPCIGAVLAGVCWCGDIVDLRTPTIFGRLSLQNGLKLKQEGMCTTHLRWDGGGASWCAGARRGEARPCRRTPPPAAASPGSWRWTSRSSDLPSGPCAPFTARSPPTKAPPAHQHVTTQTYHHATAFEVHPIHSSKGWFYDGCGCKTTRHTWA